MTAEELKKMYPEQFEKIPTEILKPQPAAPKLDLGKILTDAAMRHPKEVNNFLDEYVGSEGKSLLLSTITQTHPGYAPVIEKLFPTNNNKNGNGSHKIEIEDSNPLDDNDETKDYDIPDTEILDEVRNFACSLHLSGYGWAQIGDQIYSKYDIDWNPLKIKDIVLKNLAWNHRNYKIESQPIPTMPLGVPQKPQDEKKGLIRRFISWLW